MRARLRLTFVLVDRFFPPAHGGAHMIRVLAEGFAALGHDVRAILLFETENEADPLNVGPSQTLGHLKQLAIPFRVSAAKTIRFAYGGVRYSGVERDSDRFLSFVVSELRASGADTVILSEVGGAAAHVLLRIVHECFDGGIIYYPMSVHMLPGGPLCISADEAAAAVVDKCRVVVPSEFSAHYIAEHFGTSANICIPPMFKVDERAMPDTQSRFGGPIALFHPSTWKGLPVLLGLADARPDLQFLVRCAWRTTSGDFAALRARPNIVIQHQKVADTETIYELASVALTPSLCYELLGLIPIEAMLRGLPSLASSHGGLKEAALGLPFSLPVRPIIFHRNPSDPGARPREEVPQQALQPWLDALDQVCGDRSFYADLSARAWNRARHFARSLSWETTQAAFFR